MTTTSLLMPTDIVDSVLAVLKAAKYGKSETKTPLPMAAYQILDKLPERDQLITERVMPGKGNGTRTTFSAAQVVSDAGQMLARRGLVDITYHDSTGTLYIVAGQTVEPGFEAHARYQFRDPNIAPTPAPAPAQDLTLSTAIEHFPMLKDTDPKELHDNYTMLTRFAPKSMSEPQYLGSVLVQLAAINGIPAELLKTILEVEQLHVKVSL